MSRAAADREGLPRRGARGRPAVHARDAAEDVVGPAQLPVGAAAGAARHSAHHAAQGHRGAVRRRASAADRWCTPTRCTGRPARSSTTRAGRGITDWAAELEPHYDQASRMLGVTEQPSMTPSDVVIRRWPRTWASGTTFRRTPVGVFFGDARQDRAGSLFRWRRPGPDRLHRVRQLHDRLPVRRQEPPRPELPVPGRTGRRGDPPGHDGDRDATGAADGWRGASRGDAPTFTAGQVVLAAGALGTQRLLHAMRDTGVLPQRLGPARRR